MRALGVDPGLRRTGWGVVEMSGSRLVFIACGTITPPVDGDMGVRLNALQAGVDALLAEHRPDGAAIETPFVNANAQSSMKLGMAWGVAAAAAARAGLPVTEYAPRLVKKAIVGAGGAEKAQVAAMVARLLPTAGAPTADAADALA
ncbi:MAG: crossover junction endodeoxyribonuclease RuvC, partial [Pseudomonadota bacterium]